MILRWCLEIVCDECLWVLIRTPVHLPSEDREGVAVSTDIRPRTPCCSRPRLRLRMTRTDLPFRLVEARGKEL